MRDKVVDVTNRYSREILDIGNILRHLENGRIYELSGAQMDGYLATNIAQLKKKIAELISKIEYGEDSISDELSDLFSK